MRVVSLVPSVTETLLAWGVRPVACTRFCEQPAIRSIGGTKNPDVAAIVALAPDLVVMDEEENRREDHEALERAGVPVHVLAIRDLADVSDQLPALAARLGVEPVGVEPVGVEPPRVARPEVARSGVRAVRRAFVPIWRRPYMALGEPTYGSSLLRTLGVVNVMADRGPYPAVTHEEAAAVGPELVIAPSEPYPFGPRHAAELEAVAPTVFVDGKDLFWWGARTRSALERLGASLAR
jgi:ABC-type Fe3+-hydroxamate transport system substrate-binding protein